MLEVRFNYLVFESLEFYLESYIVAESSSGVSFIIRLEINDVFVEIGFSSGFDLVWYFTFGMFLFKNVGIMEGRNKKEV